MKITTASRRAVQRRKVNSIPSVFFLGSVRGKNPVQIEVAGLENDINRSGGGTGKDETGCFTWGFISGLSS